MSRREPPDVAILAARIMRAWPSLSPFSAASLAVELCAIERAQRRHAERQCSGEDGGYVRLVVPPTKPPGDSAAIYRAALASTLEHDPAAEQRAGERIQRRLTAWRIAVVDRHPEPSRRSTAVDVELHGDPRGRVLLLRLPGELEASTV